MIDEPISEHLSGLQSFQVSAGSKTLIEIVWLLLTKEPGVVENRPRLCSFLMKLLSGSVDA